ncbi:MAG: pseudouridine synthase, partial [Pseudomonadota bacterium]
SIERAYEALVWGAPDRGDPRLAGLRGVSFARRGEADPALWGRIETQIARSASDRKKMAVVSKGGRRAVTWFQVAARFGAAARPAAAAIECRLETGRTHQIRVHLAYAGHGLIGDPSYGRASASRLDALPAPARAAAAGFGRQALHAGALGFIHPVTEAPMRFSAPPPEDHVALRAALEAL